MYLALHQVIKSVIRFFKCFPLHLCLTTHFVRKQFKLSLYTRKTSSNGEILGSKFCYIKFNFKLISFLSVTCGVDTWRKTGFKTICYFFFTVKPFSRKILETIKIYIFMSHINCNLCIVYQMNNRVTRPNENQKNLAATILNLWLLCCIADCFKTNTTFPWLKL